MTHNEWAKKMIEAQIQLNNASTELKYAKRLGSAREPELQHAFNLAAANVQTLYAIRPLDNK